MYFLFYGTDKNKARAAASLTVAAARKKHAEAEFFRLNTDNFSLDRLDELISSQGLFYSGSLIQAYDLCSDKDIPEILVKKLKEIKESQNFFVFVEEKINKKELDIFKKYAEKVTEFSKPARQLTKKEIQKEEGEKIDFFEFTNALGERNKKLLWTLYQEALEGEVHSEEVHSMYFWQVKAMLAAAKSKDAVEAGLNPFVYTKSKGYAKNYSEDKLVEMSRCLFNMYHLAHRGKEDFAVALEKFILAL